MSALPHLLNTVALAQPAVDRLAGAGQLLAASGLSHLGQRVDSALDRVYIPAGVVLEALAAAACYAASSVLQQQAASAQPRSGALKPTLVLALLRQPRWWLGTVADVGAYGFEFLALRRGSLALVSPLIVVGLIFALPVSAVMAHRRLTLREWLATFGVVAGLAMFLAVARPGPGNPHASTTGWLSLAGLVAATVGALVALAGPTSRRRALCLGAATGIVIGASAAVTERTGHLLDQGLAHALSNWPPYALLVTAALGLSLNQSAYQAGDLKWSLPVLVVLEPLTAIAIGQLLFNEHISLGGLSPLWEALGLVLMGIGVFSLARVRRPEPGAPQGPGPPLGREALPAPSG